VRDKLADASRDDGRPAAMRRVGLKDVAARAGVSINTVSRAIRAPQTVRPELRRQIEALLDELDYVPNRLAGGLAGASTEVVGVILTSLFYSEYAAMIDALQGGLARAGLSVMIGNSHYDLDEELALVRTMLSWRPAAMALVGTDHHPRVQELLATAAIPVVEIWEAAEDRIDSAVGMDHGAIGRMQARHLVDLGCRRIAFIGCVRRHDYRAQRRRDGCLEVLADHGLVPTTVTAPDGGSADLGEALLERLLDAHPGIDGIACNSDVIAMGALRGVARTGRRVPDDIAVIGFGDNEASACLTPTLSTIRPPRAAIGIAAAEIILARIEGEPPQNRIFEAELVERASTARRRLEEKADG
jgi:LacI family transcriptional regulator, gluconate utilization system Gnt-I transcriptional repressor